MNENEVIIPSGNKGTPEEPYVIAYMCASTFMDEVTATTSRMFPSIEAHRAGCACGRWGSVEVAVHFVRFIKSQESKEKEAEEEEEKKRDRENLKGVAELIRNIQAKIARSSTEGSNAKGLEMVDYWLDRHELKPNGHALFWALDCLRRYCDTKPYYNGFWMDITDAGQELSDKWSVEARTTQS